MARAARWPSATASVSVQRVPARTSPTREQRWRGGTALFIDHDMPSGVTRKGIWQKFRGRRLIDIDEHRAGRNGFRVPALSTTTDCRPSLPSRATMRPSMRLIPSGTLAAVVSMTVTSLAMPATPRLPAPPSRWRRRRSPAGRHKVAHRKTRSGEAASFVAVFLGRPKCPLSSPVAMTTARLV